MDPFYDQLASRTGSLPDPYAIGGSQIHLVARLSFESVIPAINVPRRPNNPKLPRRMGIAHDLLAHEVLGRRPAPRLRPTQKHALLPGEAVQQRSLRTFQ